MREADVSTDHYLVRTSIRLKMTRIVTKKTNGIERSVVRKLQSEEIRKW